MTRTLAYIMLVSLLVLQLTKTKNITVTVTIKVYTVRRDIPVMQCPPFL